MILRKEAPKKETEFERIVQWKPGEKTIRDGFEKSKKTIYHPVNDPLTKKDHFRFQWKRSQR